ncbi:MAG: IS110 family transposase [Polyangia bacterium]|jgi:transposase|nr:IS110 family transposase [Polyangia bacterium]
MQPGHRQNREELLCKVPEVAPRPKTPGFVGIDVGAESHTVHVVDASGAMLLPTINVPNSITGFVRLMDRLDRLALEHRISGWTVGLESSYGDEHQVALFLRERGCEVLRVIPKEVEAQRCLLRRSGAKSDARDAAAIAKVVCAGCGTPMQFRTPEEQDLREAVNELDHVKRHRRWVRDRCQHQVQARYRTTARQAARFLKSDTGRAFIAEYPSPPDMSEMNLSEFITTSRFRLRTRVDSRVLKQLFAICKENNPHVRAGNGGPNATETSIQSLMELDRQIDELRERIDGMLQGNKHIALLRTIPGVGPEIAPVILSRAGDIRRFDHPAQFERYVGLDIVQDLSSNWRSRARISKSGDARLRKALYDAASAATRLNTNNRFGHRYQEIKSRKGDTPEVRKKALVKIAAKMARTVWAVIAKETPYCENNQPT